MSKALDLQPLEEYLPHHQAAAPDVSKASVGWHLFHSLKVIASVSKALSLSDPENYQPQENAMRNQVFATGQLKRGVAQAPKSALPPESFSEEEIRNIMAKATEKLEIVQSLPDNAFFTHPSFGNLNKADTLRFLEIHTNHHLAIIRDIVDQI
jgi:hypothetical protein